MAVDVWLTYVATVLALMSTPGPSHLLMLSTSVANGFRRSTATAAGDLTANMLQMLAAGLGLATLLVASRDAFAVVKWVGVAYLAWLGAKTLLRSFAQDTTGPHADASSVAQLWLRGFVTSAANPKAVVFFAALFPQFIDQGRPLALQLLVLGATYVAIDGFFLLTYGAGASWLARRLQGPVQVWLDRFAGVSMLGAAMLLGLKSVRDR